MCGHTAGGTEETRVARRWDRGPEWRWPWQQPRVAPAKRESVVEEMTRAATEARVHTDLPEAGASEAPEAQAVAEAPAPEAAPAEAAPAEAAPAEAGTHEVSRSSWSRWLGTKRVAAVVLLLLAGEIAYVVHLNASNSSNNSLAPFTQNTFGAPSTTTPPAFPTVVVPPPITTTTAPPAATSDAPPATSPKPAIAATTASHITATPGYCTTRDVEFTTGTNAGSYGPGSTVVFTMQVTDVTSCIFQPVVAGSSSCAAYLFVGDNGAQVFPSTQETEPCDPPSAQTMNPGSKDSLVVQWTVPEDAAANGQYQAVGQWGWSAGPGLAANSVNVASNSFSVS